MARHKFVSPHTHVKEHPEHFRVDNNILFCKFCNVPVEWKRKSTVNDHVNSRSHQENKIKPEQSSTHTY